VADRVCRSALISTSRGATLIVSLAIVFCVTLDCSDGTKSRAPMPTDLSVCGDATRLVAFPGQAAWHGARVGPLFFSAFGPDANQALIRDFRLGYPTKVVIAVAGPMAAPLTLRGSNCSTGEELRFWYRDQLPFATLPVGREQLQSTGDTVALLEPPRPQPSGRIFSYGGYMFFTQADKWSVRVLQEGRLLGTITVMVSAPAA
jgi:hypothetical protein